MKGFNATVGKLIIDGVEQAAGTYTGSSGTWITGSGTLTITGMINDFDTWIAAHPGVGAENGFSQDPDKDGMSNGVESYLGTDPAVSSSGLEMLQKSSNEFTFSHSLHTNPLFNITATYEWSPDLINYYAVGVDDGNGTQVNFVSSAPVNGIVTVTATVGGSVPDEIFFRLKVTQIP